MQLLDTFLKTISANFSKLKKTLGFCLLTQFKSIYKEKNLFQHQNNLTIKPQKTPKLGYFSNS